MGLGSREPGSINCVNLDTEFTTVSDLTQVLDAPEIGPLQNVTLHEFTALTCLCYQQLTLDYIRAIIGR